MLLSWALTGHKCNVHTGDCGKGQLSESVVRYLCVAGNGECQCRQYYGGRTVNVPSLKCYGYGFALNGVIVKVQ